MFVVTLGDLLLDVIVRLGEPLATGADANADTLAAPGGQAANVAAWVVALGGRARCVVRRGDDLAGALLAGELESRGVELVGPAAGRTGAVVSLVTADGERTLASDRGTATLLEPSDLDPGWFACDCLHISGYALLASPIDAAAIRAAELARTNDARAGVALETTLVAHGFPPGEGVEVGRRAEARVREAGAVPATVGVLDGRIRVGLSSDELERFDASARKAGPRDLAVCAAQGLVGATTVGGTLAVCRAAGITFMGTGGLGGVHRGFPHPPDVSADLGELARTQALVVSSGIKSLLDVAATLELLESLGVPLLGYGVDTLPLFYAAAGGPPVSARVESPA